MLESRNLSFSYDGKTQILRSVDIQVHPGEIVILAGPTGSGKSTLAKCLAGFIPRSIQGEFSGITAIDDVDMTGFSISEISRLVSLVQQDPDSQICTLNVVDEVAFGPENYEFELKLVKNLVESSLSAVDAFHLHNRITHTLSGGEKQRLAIASMLPNQSKYLILDEPSASLDPKGILSLRKILLRLKKEQVGILCIEHNLNAFKSIADRILSISNGKISQFVDVIDEPSLSTVQPSSIQGGKQLLSLQNVSFSYGTSPVIRNISLGLHSGEVVALMGGNGSGKTTLVSLLGGLLKPTNGKVMLDSLPISDLERKDIAKRISIVFQNPNHQIFERTVWKEQTLTSEILGDTTEATFEQSRKLLSSANLDTYLDRNPFSLSHGQKRRLNVTSTG